MGQNKAGTYWTHQNEGFFRFSIKIWGKKSDTNDLDTFPLFLPNNTPMVQQCRYQVGLHQFQPQQFAVMLQEFGLKQWSFCVKIFSSFQYLIYLNVILIKSEFLGLMAPKKHS